MTRTRLRVFAVTSLLCLAGAVLGDSGPDNTLKEIAGYREWTRINQKPIVVDLSFATGG